MSTTVTTATTTTFLAPLKLRPLNISEGVNEYDRLTLQCRLAKTPKEYGKSIRKLAVMGMLAEGVNVVYQRDEEDKRTVCIAYYLDKTTDTLRFAAAMDYCESPTAPTTTFVPDPHPNRENVYFLKKVTIGGKKKKHRPVAKCELRATAVTRLFLRPILMAHFSAHVEAGNWESHKYRTEYLRHLVRRHGVRGYKYTHSRATTDYDRMTYDQLHSTENPLSPKNVQF